MKHIIRLALFVAFIAFIVICSQSCTKITVISCPSGAHEEVCTCGDGVSEPDTLSGVAPGGGTDNGNDGEPGNEGGPQPVEP